MQCHVDAHRTHRPSPSFRTDRSRALQDGTGRSSVSPALPLLRHVATIGSAVLLYFFVRGLVDARADDASRHAVWLIDLEQRLGIFWEPRLQAWALGAGPVRTVANWVYIWGHWPVIAATLVWLVVRHPAVFPRYRNAMLLSGAVGLIFFALYPMAPPRFMDAYGFVDTITLHSRSYRVLQPPSLVNQYAAMPSLHCGWDLLMGIAIARHAPRRLRWIGYVLPLAMVSSVVLTANHYILDAVVGMGLVVASLWVVAMVGQVTLTVRIPKVPGASTVIDRFPHGAARAKEGGR